MNTPARPAFFHRLSLRTRWMLGVGLLVVGGLVALNGRPAAKSAQVVPVTRSDLQQNVLATGRIGSDTRLEVGSEVTATVTRVAVREGDTVAAGDVLIQLNDAEAQATLTQAQAALAEARARQAQLGSVGAPVAEAALAQARATLVTAEAEHRRAQELVAQGFFARQKADDALRALVLAQNALAAAQSQAVAQRPQGAEGVLAHTRLAQAEAAVEAARARLARLTLRSPVAGTVLTRAAEPGNLAQPGKVLLTLASLAQLRIEAGVDEKHLALLQPGLAARAVADAYPGQPFDARLAWVSPTLDATRGTVEVRLTMPQPPVFLKPDMTVSVEMTVGQRQQALVVDAGAVRGMDTGSPWVLALRDGVATRSPVTLGLRGTGVVEVTQGLAEGEQAIPATEKVAEGDRVRPVRAAAVPVGGVGMGR